MRRFLPGITDFARIIRENIFYADKTRYIEMLENDAPYLMFIRPRRFGKSLFVGMLTLYYDLAAKDRFESLFGKLYIGKHPTPERNSYLVLNFNFSLLNTYGTEEELKASFYDHCNEQFLRFASRYRTLLHPDLDNILAQAPTPEAKLSRVCRLAEEKDLPIYVIIDEYDNFANNILAGAEEHDRYARLTHGAGFFRTFFTFLKGGASPLDDKSPAIKRIFMTGVSPLVLDDVTSGFNIAQNISVKPKYNAMLGFTETEVREALQGIQTTNGFQGTQEEHLDTMREYYDNYRFSDGCEKVFNTNMALYYLGALEDNGTPPRSLLDSNTRTDYQKLHRLIVLGNRLNGNFNVLCELAVERRLAATLVDRFPLDELKNRDQFVSLLFYMGIVTIDKPFLGGSLFRIPNRTVGEILVSYIQSSLQEVGGKFVGIEALQKYAVEMALHGKWRGMLEYIHENIVSTTSIRDFIEGERAIQIAHLVVLWPVKCYLTRTEREASKGYLDMLMVPDNRNSAEVKYTYVLEFKYLPEKASDADLARAIADAKAQLSHYSTDALLRSQCAGTTLTLVAVIYKQWDIAYCDAIDTMTL